jgi:F-type H+-transporting ATPase subunit b
MITPSLATFLITIINIAVLFFVLRAFLFKPVTKFMENRTNQIRGTIEAAEQDKAQAKLLLAQYEERLKIAGAEVEAIIRRARETGQREADRLTAEGKAAAELLLANARSQIEAEQRAAMAIFKAEAAALVISASARLLKRELKADDLRSQAALILQELGKNS